MSHDLSPSQVHPERVVLRPQVSLHKGINLALIVPLVELPINLDGINLDGCVHSSLAIEVLVLESTRRSNMRTQSISYMFIVGFAQAVELFREFPESTIMTEPHVQQDVIIAAIVSVKRTSP